MDLARAAASPVDKEINGENVVLSPLTFRNFGRIETWMRQELINNAKESIKDPSMSELTSRLIMSEAHKVSLTITISNKDVADGIMSSFESCLRMIHMSMQKTKPSLEIEDVEKMIGNDTEKLQELALTIMEISFPDQFDKKAATGSGAEKKVTT